MYDYTILYIIVLNWSTNSKPIPRGAWENGFVLFVCIHRYQLFSIWIKIKTNLKKMRKQIEVPQLFLVFRYGSNIDACVMRFSQKRCIFSSSSNWFNLCKLSHHCLRRCRKISANQGVRGALNLAMASSSFSRFKYRTSLTSLALGCSVTSFCRNRM